MSLLALLGPDGGHDVDAVYVRRLVEMPPSMLENEGKSLATTYGTNESAAQELAAKHRANFLSSKTELDRVSSLIHELQQTSAAAAEAVQMVPRVPDKAYTTLRALLDGNLAVYRQIDQIQELLALPELVKDHVLRADFATALDLAGMADRLARRFPASPLVQQLRRDVHRSVAGMEDILRRSLRQAMRLPQLTKAVSLLRRLEESNLDNPAGSAGPSLSGDRDAAEISSAASTATKNDNGRGLEAEFVEARWEFLEFQWAGIPAQLRDTQPLAYLKRVIEIYREHVFATINGYQTIFKLSDDKSLELPISQFAREALVALLEQLRTHAPKILDHGDRTSLWLQLAFCAQSLGRIECDFWPFLDESILSKEEWAEASQYQRDMARRALRK